jgi:Ca-activated chloride channel family protein
MIDIFLLYFKKSIYWLNPETLKRFDWENPLYLYLIPAVPVLLFLRWLVTLRLRQKLDFAFFSHHIKSSWITLLRFIPSIIFGFFICMVLLALARPQLSNQTIEQSAEGIDIVLAIDISESMTIGDFKPNRLEAAKKVALNFVNGRKHDRIGLVVFSGEAFSLAPLTTDYELTKSLIKEINYKMITKSGTAIGNALAVSLNRLKETNSKSKIIILISDGANIEGTIDPKTAAKLNHALNVKIYTIGVGKDGEVPYKDEKETVTMIKNTLDESTLREIAYITQGQYFRASDIHVLKNVFYKINQLEKTEIKEKKFKDTKDYYHPYLYFAVILFLFWLLLKSTFISNPLED